MKIGLPKAFFYFRYGVLWEHFFLGLGCDVLVGEDTSRAVLSWGAGAAVDESCLPMKIFMGQVKSLQGRCDYIFVPRMEGFAYEEEFCVRFFGLYDTVRSTYKGAPIIGYNIRPGAFRGELSGFLRMGRKLGKGPIKTLLAYRRAKEEQKKYDQNRLEQQNHLLKESGIKILLAAQPYLLHDAWTGAPIVRMLREQGAIPLYSDRCHRQTCIERSKEISSDLYWTMNKEIVGAVAAYKERVDGVILLTAFPCGTDCLANELTLRRVKDVPIIQILLDEQQGEVGLQTRIESFLDILKERKKAYGA